MTSKSDGNRSSRIDGLVLDHLQRRLSGEHVSDAAMIAQHPDLMPELSVRLAEISKLSPRELVDDRNVGNASTLNPNALQIRCPHCHQRVEVLVDSDFEDITCSACGSQFSLAGETVHTLEAPTYKQIAQFELVERLGLGSFGTVWKARDTELDRTVAVKIPRRGQLDPSQIEKFQREARAAAQLNHKNIVRIYEVGRDGDNVYIVSELIRGVSLADWLTAKQPTFREAAELCAKLANALHHAHENGVIHRDLKPHNIMLDSEDEPHIMDFGLAKREAGEVTMTMDGHILGTPAYMSPEQARGEAHRADRRTDIYSLGALLFELLTGELPFRGNSRMLIHQVISEDAPSPRKLNSSLPKDLETICLKCLEKEPENRYASAQELADELGRFLGDEPIRARPISAVQRAWRWCCRKPAAAAVVALLSLFALAGPLVAVHQSTLTRQKSRLLYVSDMNVALRAWELGNVDRVRELLNRHRPSPRQTDLRRFEWFYLWNLCEQSRSQSTLQLNDEVTWAAVSRDGRILATAIEQAVILWNPRTHEEIGRLNGHREQVRCISFSPDGTTLASAADDVRLWDVTSGKQLEVLKGHRNSVWTVAFSLDGTMLASGGEDASIRLWDVETGDARGTLQEHTETVSALAFGPDGQTFVSSSHDQSVIVWDLPTLGKKHTLKAHSDWVGAIALSPDGEALASAGGDRAIILWNLRTGQPQATLTGHREPVLCVAFSRNGDRLVSGSADNSIRVWDVASRREMRKLTGHVNWVTNVVFLPEERTLLSTSLDGTVKFWNPDETVRDVLKGHQHAVASVSFSPDGRLLASASADRSIRLWRVDTGELIVTLHGHQSLVRQLSFSPDGYTLASCSADETIKIWDLKSRKERQALRGHHSEVQSLAYSPDGTLLASVDKLGALKLWNTINWQERTFERHRDGVTRRLDLRVRTSVAFSPDGKKLVSCGADREMHLWDISGDREIQTFSGHTRTVMAAVFSPDGKTLASASMDSTIKMWSVASGALVATLEGHSGPVWSIAFSPDGRTLASGGGGNLIKLWDVVTRQERATLAGHTNFVGTVAFSPDGRTLASGSDDNTVRLWRTY